MRDIHDGDDISGLILRVSLRDRAAFDRLYQATGPKLFGTCLRILRNKAEAEEAVQEVFVKIWLKADRFSVTGQSPMSWLIAIARNQAIDRLRMRRDVTGGIDDAALDIRDFDISLPSALMLRIYPDVVVRFRVEAVVDAQPNPTTPSEET